MKFEWDENKNKSNIEKHRIDFEQAKLIFNDLSIVTFEDRRVDYGETRFIAIGQMFLKTQNKIITAVVVYTKRNREIIRIISARKANKREQKIYEQKEGSF